jgi:hypothetical protein
VQASQIELVGNDNPGFHHIADVKATGIYPDDIVALFSLLKNVAEPRYMKVYMPQNVNRNYYTGYSPRTSTAIGYSDLSLPTLMVQTKGEAWSAPFVAIYEPFFGKDGSSMQKVIELHHSNDFVILLVEGKNGEQQYIFQGLNPTTQEFSTDNYSFKGYFGVVSLKNNSIQYIYLGQGKKIAFGDYMIEGQDDNCSVYIDFTTGELKITSNQPVEVTVKGSIFLPTS